MLTPTGFADAPDWAGGCVPCEGRGYECVDCQGGSTAPVPLAGYSATSVLGGQLVIFACPDGAFLDAGGATCLRSHAIRVEPSGFADDALEEKDGSTGVCLAGGGCAAGSTGPLCHVCEEGFATAKTGGGCELCPSRLAHSCRDYS